MKQGKRTPIEVFEDFMKIEGCADALAESLMVHDDCCGMHAAGKLVLEMAGLSELDFLLSWMGGKYSG